GGSGRSEAFSGRRRDGRAAEDVRSEEPVYSHRYARVFPPGQPDVLIDQAGQLITELVRLLPVAAQCRAGDAERMRYGHECGNWRRGVNRAGQRTFVCRSAELDGEFVGGA